MLINWLSSVRISVWKDSTGPRTSTGPFYFGRWVQLGCPWRGWNCTPGWGREFPLTVVVANLGGRSAILGLDFLEQYEATLKVSHGNMAIGDTDIRLHREDVTKGCCRVGLGETLSIPPGSFKIVDAVVDQRRLASKKTVPGLGAVEGLPGLAEMCGVIMDRGLVTVWNGKVPVNPINVHDQTITLHRGKTLGQLQHVISVVKMSVPSSQCHVETVQRPTKLLGMNDIPEHTRDVLDEETISELSAEQTHKVCETIQGYPERFLVPEGKTWRTEMIDHGVDVQVNAPSKQCYKPWPLAKQKAADEQVKRCWMMTSWSPVTAHGPAKLYLSQKGKAPFVSV